MPKKSPLLLIPAFLAVTACAPDTSEILYGDQEMMHILAHPSQPQNTSETDSGNRISATSEELGKVSRKEGPRVQVVTGKVVKGPRTVAARKKTVTPKHRHEEASSAMGSLMDARIGAAPR